MLIPLAEVPRWYADRNPQATVAVRHGADELTWEMLERNANRRARAFAGLGVKAGDFVAIGLPNSNVFYETSFAVWKLGATPTSLSHRLPRGEAAAILDILKPSLVVGGEPGTALLNPGPLYHNAPFIVSHFALFAGGSVTGLPKFDAEEALRLIDRHKLEWVNFVPTMMHRIWSLPEEVRSRYDVSSLKTVFHMAAPMPAWLKEKWIEWLGPEKIHELYGGTERQGRTVISGTEWLAHRGSVGKVDPTACAIRIVGEDGNDVPVGETGEVYFMPADGVGTTYHYIGAEPKRRPDGWESIGDVGRLDEDGYLYLGDRLTDMILRGGANIYPAEVEAAVMAHPDVHSSIVVGLPDPDLGSRIHALIEINPGADAQAVIDSMGPVLTDLLSRNKHPESYEISTVTLRDDSGKTRRTLLRDERIAWLKAGRDFRLHPASGNRS